jgi:hypothetical protein
MERRTSGIRRLNTHPRSSTQRTNRFVIELSAALTPQRMVFAYLSVHCRTRDMTYCETSYPRQLMMKRGRSGYTLRGKEIIIPSKPFSKINESEERKCVVEIRLERIRINQERVGKCRIKKVHSASFIQKTVRNLIKHFSQEVVTTSIILELSQPSTLLSFDHFTTADELCVSSPPQFFR